MKRFGYVHLLLLVAIAMLIVSSFITYINAREKRESQRLVAQGYEVIHSMEKLFSNIKDMESGHRGYVIAGDSAFLQSYVDGKIRLDIEIDSLKVLAASNQQQTQFLNNHILPVVSSRRRSLELGINLYNTFGADTAISWVSNRQGQTNMDTLRVLVTTFIQNEQAMLATHRAKLDFNTMIEDIFLFSSFGMVAITCALAYFKLINERKTINQLLRELENANQELEQRVLDRTRKLRKANQDMSHFLGAASHDMKVPLTGIQRIVELLLLDTNDPREREYLELIQSSCSNMQKLVSNLLQINQIDRRKMDVQAVPIGLSSTLSQLELEFKDLALRKSVALRVDKPKLTIYTDPLALTRILENLLSNAIKFSNPGGTVELRVTQTSGQYNFEVIDNGPGISEKEIPFLFRRFAKISTKPTDGESSTGLGLAIAWEVAHLLGGTIHVKSEMGVGTTFTLSIPESAEAAKAGASTASHSV